MDAIGRNIADYRIDSVLAHGSSAIVYRASRSNPPETVAIKIVDTRLASDAGFDDRFAEEARRAAHLHHPNLVDILAWGNENDLPYLVMELCPHGTVRTLLDRARKTRQTLPIELCVGLARQTAEGIAYLHEEGLIHAHLTPEHLLLCGGIDGEADGQWRVKIGGLGLPHPGTEDDDATETPDAALEYDTKRNPSPAADIRALGVILRELVTGQRPIGTGDDRSKHDDPPELGTLHEGISADLEQIILRCLSEDPSNRFATADAVADALSELMGEDERPGKEASPNDSIRQPSLRLAIRSLGKRQTREAIYQLELGNDSGAIAHVALDAIDDDGEIRYQFAPPMVSVEPGRSRNVVLTVTDRSRHPADQRVGFVVSAMPASGVPVTARGEFERVRTADLIGRQALVGFGALGVVAVILVAVLFGSVIRDASHASTPAPTALAVVPTATSPPAPTALPSPTSTPTSAPTPTATPTPRGTASADSPLIVRRVDTNQKSVALTFSISNDAASAGKVEQILRVLRDRNAQGTFGISGDWAATHVDLVKAIAASGNQIINETYDHRSFTGASQRTGPLSSAQRVDELTKADQIVRQRAGIDMRPYYRPPFGDIDLGGTSAVTQDAAKAGYTVAVLWSIDTKSWDSSQTVGRMISAASAAKAGDVILFSISSAGGDKDANSLPQIIENLQSHGMRLVTVKELVGR